MSALSHKSEKISGDKREHADRSIGAITLLLLLVLACIHPQYRSINNYMNILREASFLGVAALGMMNVIITCNTDLSIGTMMALASVIMLKLMPTIGVLPALLLCVLTCVLLSLFNGYLVVYCKIFAFILTLGMQYVFKGVAHIITNQKIVSATDMFFTQIGNLNIFAGNGFDGIPLPFVIFLVLAIFSYILLHNTGFGRKVFAVGNSESAAKLAGVNVKRVKLATYGLLGFFVGVAGILISSRLWMASAEMRQSYEFDVITVVVMGGVAFSGGKGNVINTVISSIFFATIYNVINHFNVDPYWQYILRALLLTLAFSVSNIKAAVISRLDQRRYRQELRRRNAQC